MKSATLIVWPAAKDGSLRSVSNVSVEPIIALAKKVRDEGALDGQLVTHGHIQHSQRPYPFMQFRAKKHAQKVPAKKEPKR